MLNDKEAFERFYEQVSIWFESFMAFKPQRWILNFIPLVEEKGTRDRREGSQVCQQNDARFITENPTKDQRWEQ